MCVALLLGIGASMSSCSQDEIYNITICPNPDHSSTDSIQKGNANVNFRALVYPLMTTRSAADPSPIAQNVTADIYPYATNGALLNSKAYTATSAGALSPTTGGKMDLPIGSYIFYAVSTNTPTLPPAFTNWGATSLQNNVDYLWASNEEVLNPSGIEVNLDFKHVATQIKVNITPASLTIDSVEYMSIYPASPSQCTWSLSTGQISPSNTLSTTAVNMGFAETTTGYLGSYIMMPYNGTKIMALTLSAYINGEPTPRIYTVKLPFYSGEQSFNAGNSYIYMFALSTSGIVYSGVTVSPWVTHTIDGDPLVQAN